MARQTVFVHLGDVAYLCVVQHIDAQTQTKTYSPAGVGVSPLVGHGESFVARQTGVVHLGDVAYLSVVQHMDAQALLVVIQVPHLHERDMIGKMTGMNRRQVQTALTHNSQVLHQLSTVMKG